MKVLFVRVSRKTESSQVPQLGLAMLSAMLRASGHEVKVLDYLILPAKEEVSFSRVVKEFEPDVVGFTLFTATFSLSSQRIDEFRRLSDKPILVGGPHASVFYQSLSQDTRIDYIFKGEADVAIVEGVETARRLPQPELIDCPLPVLSELPSPDFSVFIGHEHIYHYPLQTSRGCPYRCRFCTVRFVSSLKWRKRDYMACIEELVQAKKMFPKLRNVSVVDDSPAVKKDHFKSFLTEYHQRKFKLSLIVDNIRADQIDQEIVDLVKQCDIKALCLGVEHGSPEMLKSINKGETMDDIKNAAHIIKKSGLELGLCFVIGLPGDTLEKGDFSIKLARELKPVYIYWNMAHPFPGTEIEQWYLENGGIISTKEDYSSFPFRTLNCAEPIVETSDFSRRDRKKAYFKAVAMTNTYPFSVREFYYLFTLGWQYNLFFIAMASLLRHPFYSLFFNYYRVRRRLRI